MLRRLMKPWFVYRPARLARRAWVAAVPPRPGVRPLTTAWGLPILADPAKNNGRSLLTTGVYDLTVSEAVARLVPPGGRAVDAGANIGYVTALAAVAAGPGGDVTGYEPHPELVRLARRNARAAADAVRSARVEVRAAALGETAGAADLLLPAGHDRNDGLATLDPAVAGEGAARVRVEVRTLDGEIGGGRGGESGGRAIDLLKLDVEGHELPLLRGAAGLLAAGRVRHILFEDHAVRDAAGSAVTRFLREAGFTIFSLGWTLRGPDVRPAEAGRLAERYEPPNYLATLDPEQALARCRPRGWRVLNRRFTARGAARGGGRGGGGGHGGGQGGGAAPA